MKQSAGLAIIYDNKVLLGHTTGRSWYASYGIPKGGLEDGESNIDAAIRETFEEVGIKVTKKMIDLLEYSFNVSFNKNKKIVYYYIVKINDLKDIGLSSLVIPKSQLQVKEIDWAGFLSYQEASPRIMQSQKPLLNILVSKGLLESTILNYEQFNKL
jgi:predicted NUDIX family NTP pyrophosphohydrolase